ncbi:L-threonylcarbamoyladenylate synthase type 1 TsaC, partial [Escherichia sp. TWPC-MK]
MNNNLQGDAIAAAIDVLNEERVSPLSTGRCFNS